MHNYWSDLSETSKIYRYKLILNKLKATFADIVIRRAYIQNDHATESFNGIQIQ